MSTKDEKPKRKSAGTTKKDKLENPFSMCIESINNDSVLYRNNPADLDNTPPHPTDPNRNAKGHYIRGNNAGGRTKGSKNTLSRKIIAAMDQAVSEDEFRELTQKMLAEAPEVVFKVLGVTALKDAPVTNINIGQQENSFYSGAPTPETFTYWDDDGVEKPDREANREEAQRWLDDLNTWALQKAESLS